MLRLTVKKDGETLWRKAPNRGAKSLEDICLEAEELTIFGGAEYASVDIWDKEKGEWRNYCEYES